uniref:Uncharacterized protein n=1 Tax=Leersia perrieri TaxID=77586 RepID=A0A0D9VC41_9ORYZ
MAVVQGTMVPSAALALTATSAAAKFTPLPADGDGDVAGGGDTVGGGEAAGGGAISSPGPISGSAGVWFSPHLQQPTQLSPATRPVIAFSPQPLVHDVAKKNSAPADELLCFRPSPFLTKLMSEEELRGSPARRARSPTPSLTPPTGEDANAGWGGPVLDPCGARSPMRVLRDGRNRSGPIHATSLSFDDPDQDPRSGALMAEMMGDFTLSVSAGLGGSFPASVLTPDGSTGGPLLQAQEEATLVAQEEPTVMAQKEPIDDQPEFHSGLAVAKQAQQPEAGSLSTLEARSSVKKNREWQQEPLVEGTDCLLELSVLRLLQSYIDLPFLWQALDLFSDKCN